MFKFGHLTEILQQRNKGENRNHLIPISKRAIATVLKPKTKYKAF